MLNPINVGTSRRGAMVAAVVAVAFVFATADALADTANVVTIPAAEPPLKLAIESKLCTLPGMPPAHWGALTRNTSEAHVLIEAFDLHALDGVEGAYLHSAPRITVELPNASSRLVTRNPGGQTETIDVATKAVWLDGIYASLPSHAYRPESSNDWSIIADMSEIANGALVAVKVSEVENGIATLDYIALLHQDGQLQQVRDSLHTPLGKPVALVLPNEIKTFLAVVKANLVDDSKTCAVPVAP